jgi:hypothetical protein
MKRVKNYSKEQQLNAQGWRLFVKLAEQVFGSCKSASGRVWKDRGEWEFDSLDDFLSDVNPEWSSLWMYFTNNQKLYLCYNGWFRWEIESGEKKHILTFECEADVIAQAHLIAAPVKSKKTVVFIGHGRASDWRDLKDHLVDKHSIQVEAYETGARAGHTIRDVLEEMMEKSSLAILVHTPEDELADGSFNSRPNVIHETGLFQGKLGFSRAIVLLKDGTAEFSNLAGVQQVRYSDIRQTFGEVLAWIRREEMQSSYSDPSSH